ncbi:hypothetical protein GOV10_06610, partial [Candidatus Woesearchaeota archaeon]|nr:hypothetical protein [Candidatus Woesearchaeota archaeon]
EKTVSKGGEWFIAEPSKDFHTSFGAVPSKLLQKNGKHAIDKNEFCVFDAQPIDHYHQLKQDVQKITLKDLGFISAYVGVHTEMSFAEAGTGSGGATTYFAPLVKEMFSYDVRADAANKVQKDLDRLGMGNVTLATGNVTQPADINCEVDVFLLDCPEPWNAWLTMKKCVKLGGWVMAYTPNANQLQQVVNTMPAEFQHTHSCELIERHWRVRGLVCRPETADFSHTAFLTFFRRVC